MREIKFRCWQIVSHDDNDNPIWKMIQADDLAFETFAPLVELLESDPDSEIFMQYTGLKDKNGKGKEIYEGDIIKKPNGVWGVILWKAPFFEVTVSVEHSSLYTKEFIEDSEVIGNIYENPELLTP